MTESEYLVFERDHLTDSELQGFDADGGHLSLIRDCWPGSGPSWPIAPATQD